MVLSYNPFLVLGTQPENCNLSDDRLSKMGSITDWLLRANHCIYNKNKTTGDRDPLGWLAMLSQVFIRAKHMSICKIIVSLLMALFKLATHSNVTAFNCITPNWVRTLRVVEPPDGGRSADFGYASHSATGSQV